MADFTLDPKQCALVIQDLQNDVISEGGAFAESGSPQHAKEQNVVEIVKRLAQVARQKGVPVIQIEPRSSHFIPSTRPPFARSPSPIPSATIRPFASVPSEATSKTRMCAFGVSLM
jgi:nicotinamidase-related amidase